MRLSTLRPISQHSLGFQTRSGLKGFRIRNMASAAGQFESCLIVDFYDCFSFGVEWNWFGWEMDKIVGDDWDFGRSRGLDWLVLLGIPPVGPTPSASELGIESINDIQTAPGVELNEHQRVLVGSVLDVSILLRNWLLTCLHTRYSAWELFDLSWASSSRGTWLMMCGWISSSSPVVLPCRNWDFGA